MKTTIIEGLLATVFFLSGTIIYLWKDKLKTRLSWLTEYSPRMVMFICFSKILGALGLVIPSILSLNPILVILSAFGLALIMVLALIYHLLKKEYKDIPATILFLGLLLTVLYNHI